MLVSKFMKIDKNEISLKSLKRLSLILGGIGIILIFNIGVFRALGTIMILSTILLWVYKYLIKDWTIYFQEVFLYKLETKYKRFLTFALSSKKPFYFLFGTIGLLFSSFIILGIASPKVEFFPENEPQQIFVYIEYPEGTSIQKTNQTSKLIEKEVAKIIYDKKIL